MLLVMKILEIIYDDKASSFTVGKISRSKLYGSKRRITLDVQGQECSRAALTQDGVHILPNGGTASLYIDEHGNVIERNQLKTIDDGEEEVVAPGESNPNTLPEAVQIATATDILECGITRVYALEPVFICAELEESLSQGVIYRLPDYKGCQAFLLGNDGGYFLLIGDRTGFEFIGLAEADLSPPDLEAEDMDEDLDFYML